jgi:hypothetical protein
MWGGIDMWKEESWVKGEAFRDRGVATVHVDMPGVGQSPVLAGTDGERVWTPVFDWLACRTRRPTSTWPLSTATPRRPGCFPAATWEKDPSWRQS